MNVLILNQAFYPDVVATAQHAADLATRLAEHGHQVTVVASSRAYDNPDLRFKNRENWKGVQIIRVSVLALGKSSRWRRMLNFASFILNCTVRLILLPRFDVVVAMTTPPLISFVATMLSAMKRERLVCWVMDLNPEEALAAKWLKPGTAVTRCLASLSRFSLCRAQSIVVLDRFMKERLSEKGVPPEKITIIPPWSHEDVVRYDVEGRKAFRERFGLADKFVVMYSGNHSPCHPLDTLLEASLQLSRYPGLSFCFIGGGSELEKVRRFKAERNLEQIMCLPYQPLDRLAGSLSAADLHVVVMGDPFAGIIHPCKIYNILTLGIPFLYIGPPVSHVTDLISGRPMSQISYSARHGDVKTVKEQILDSFRNARGPQAVDAQNYLFSKTIQCSRMVEILEQIGSTSEAVVSSQEYASDQAETFLGTGGK